MNLDELTDLLKQQSAPAERQVDCPDDYDIAAYMDGGLGGQEHQQLEMHLADCDFCLQRVGLLGRAIEDESENTVPELLLARSVRLVPSSRNPIFKKILPGSQRWAAAAILVLVVSGLLFNQESIRFDPQEAPSQGELSDTAQQQRNIGSISRVPNLISPVEGSTIDPASHSFTWLPVQNSLYYQVRIVSEEGDLLWQERLKDTQWQLPVQLELEADSEYFVRVDAFLTEIKSLNSDYVVFKIEDRY